jgi:hypothetical protein
MVDVQHFFVKYLFILENEVVQFHIYFFRIFQQLRGIFMQNTSSHVVHLMVFNFQQFTQIPTLKFFFLARPFGIILCCTSVVGTV